ncbi:MAG TPA: enoyl-CoA hydratase/isomerase family protein, partial [Candidatus Dormibacteraeota bacterium]|nr:enoyl-CoA hydratase/isomerase family protein [Candidatus Dormibacteraeota bacterium]
MNLTEVLYGVEDRVATITINRPERRNAMRATTIRELLSAFSAARLDAGVGAVVLTGAGDRAFSAGADLSGFASEATDIERHLERSEFVDLFLAIDRLGKPTVAAVNGAALAGGLGLALSCDLVVAGENATFGTPEIGVGLWPMMVMAIVGRNLPRKRALQLYTTGERIDARTAGEWGMVNRVVPTDRVVEEARELAGSLAAKSP